MTELYAHDEGHVCCHQGSRLCCLLQGASPDLEEAFQDKDEAFECVTTLLDDTLEQADIALEAAKKALKHGDCILPKTKGTLASTSQLC